MQHKLYVAFLAIMAFPLVFGATRYEFALRFSTVPVHNVNHGKATSQVLTSTISPGDLSFYIGESGGNSAVWISELVSFNQENNTWTEEGNITFSMGDTISFHSVGEGHAFNGPNPGDSYGGIAYAIESGTGMFEGVTGIMVDTFVSVANQTEFEINAWAIMWV